MNRHHSVRFRSSGRCLALLVFALVGSGERALATTFEQWRATKFTSAEIGDPAISGAAADPDGDGSGNWREFVLNTDPKAPDAINWPDAALQSEGHLRLGFFRWSAHPGVVYVPQVAGALGGRWQSGPAYVPEIAVAPLDAASDYVTVRDVASTGTNLSRFIRLMIAIDSDGDGLPDSWEIRNGLSPNDPTDGAEDLDGDGILNADEFAQGTDPLLPPAAPPGLTPPDSPLRPPRARSMPSLIQTAERRSTGPTIRITKAIS